MRHDSFTAHGFWSLIEAAWTRVQDEGARASLLATILEGDLYGTTRIPLSDLDIDALRDSVEDINYYLPFVGPALEYILKPLSAPRRESFYATFDALFTALSAWDGDADLHIMSGDRAAVSARCWVILCGREIYHALRSDAVTYAFLDYVDSGEMCQMARELFFEVGKAGRGREPENPAKPRFKRLFL